MVWLVSWVDCFRLVWTLIIVLAVSFDCMIALCLVVLSMCFGWLLAWLWWVGGVVVLVVGCCGRVGLSCCCGRLLFGLAAFAVWFGWYEF